ncbi:MAG: FAD:protein FMN transferase [Paramuribaculum sp.]|nr:FAD:protein FMN transferase [Paramuribaculum sp.]
MNRVRFAIVILAALLCLGSCGGKEWRKYEGATWGTTFHITYFSEYNLDDSIIATMRGVELSLSPFDKESLVSRLNRGEDAVCDSLFLTVYAGAREIWVASGGAFDPTVAPAVNLWGFGYKNSGIEPSQSDIDRIKGLVDFGKIELSGLNLIRPSGVELDFSAITKGYGCDMVAEMLQRNGCSDYMVEIGGEIALAGKNNRGENWHIMVDAPVENNESVVHDRMAVIELTECGLATSGNYRNYRETSSGKVWHTIDPRTCRPAVSRTLSATVIAENAMFADALATACMVLPADSAIAMIEKMKGASAMLVLENDSIGDCWKTIVSKDFPVLR